MSNGLLNTANSKQKLKDKKRSKMREIYSKVDKANISGHILEQKEGQTQEQQAS